MARNQERHPGGNRGAAVQAPELEAPVITSLTDAERAELAKKNGQQNKQSSDNARMQGRR